MAVHKGHQGHKQEIASVLSEVAKFVSVANDDAILREWLNNYYLSQHDRIFEDIQLCMANLEQGFRILDVGCAPFFTTIGLHKLGYQVSGIDISPERFSLMLDAAGLDVRKCNIEVDKIPFPENHFDLVLFSEVFEHLRIDPIFTLREMHRVLGPGGKLLLTTVNLLEFKKALRLLLHRKTSPLFEEYYKLKSLGHMGHAREYTVNDVRVFAERIGFSCEDVVFRGMAPWSSRPFNFVCAVAHRLVPSSRPWFTLVLTK